MSKDVRMEIRIDENAADEIDAWRRKQRDLPSRSEAARRLIAVGLSEDREAQLYALTRFQLLLAALTPATRDKLSPAYVHAWYHDVYPAHDDGADLHQAFAGQFRVSPDQMQHLLEFLADRWDEKKPITYYQIEDHFRTRYDGSEWSRGMLISACRYFFLHDLFDSEFWAAMFVDHQYPQEAAGITSPDDDFTIYLN